LLTQSGAKSSSSCCRGVADMDCRNCRRLTFRSTTSPLFSCFAAMTRGAFPSRFIRDPVASFTRLRRSSGSTLRRTAAALVLSFTTVSLSLMLATVEALLFGVDGYEGVPERTTFAQEAIWGAAFGAMGEGSVSALLTAFLMRVMSSTIGCKLFSFPRFSCADGCSRVFLARVITLLRKASRDWDGSLARLVLSSSNSAVASAMIWVACSRWLGGWIPN